MLDINHICSLGSLCHTAEFIKRNKLKLSSYPFDWIFSNYSDIISCIEDNFCKFLDKSYYKIDNSDSQCIHSYYNTIKWFHHNPLISIDHYNYYVRCVSRFKELLKYPDHKLFIIMFVNNDEVDENIEKSIIEFNKKLSNYTNNYTLLIIFNIKNMKKNYHAFKYIDNIHFLAVHTLSISNGVRFNNENDNIYLDNILNTKYRFKLKRSNI